MLRTVSNYKNVILRGPESPCNLKHVHWGSPFWGSKLLWRREHIWWPFWGVTTNELLNILKPTKLMGSTDKIGGITTENWDSWDKHDDPFCCGLPRTECPIKSLRGSYWIHSFRGPTLGYLRLGRLLHHHISPYFHELGRALSKFTSGVVIWSWTKPRGGRVFSQTNLAWMLPCPCSCKNIPTGRVPYGRITWV